MLYSTTLEDRLDFIRERIQIAATNSGRKQKHITLVAITKKFPVEISISKYKNKNTIILMRVNLNILSIFC